MSNTATELDTTTTLKEPSMYNVIYLNDEVTTIEFVIDSLCSIFHYNEDTATRITEDIHAFGSAVVAVLPFEVAEQKGIEVTVSARESNYPLQVKLEPEN